MHHPTEDRVVAVMAVDVPLTFLYKLIDDTLMNFCREQRMYCFLFDDRGYVVAHRNLFVDTDTTPQPFEQMHLTHKVRTVSKSFHDRTNERIKHVYVCIFFFRNPPSLATFYKIKISLKNIYVIIMAAEACSVIMS